ncbi:MAG TPA: glycosyltransferase [Ignavibacteriaceae bacterium]|nr:glycosyltransferase [Ignavibacteriaceae bacterium]
MLAIIPGFPSDESDDTCLPSVQEYFYALKLKYPEIRISVIAVHYPYEKRNYKWNQINVFALGGSRTKLPKRIVYWLSAIIFALRINRNCKVNVVHSFWMGETALVGLLISALLNKKHVNTIMGQDAQKNNIYLKILPLKFIETVAVSDFQAGIFKYSSGENASRIINWGIAGNGNISNTREYDIVGTGALIPVKGYNLFVRIISEVKKIKPDLRCLLIGDGVKKNEIIKLINSLNLGNNIELTGHISRKEVLEYMKKSKILLHTSDYESFGYVIVEALSSGCYVVCRETGCAKRSEKIFISENKTEFIYNVLKILQSNFIFEPSVPYSLNKTVENYFNVYHNIVN